MAAAVFAAAATMGMEAIAAGSLSVMFAETTLLKAAFSAGMSILASSLSDAGRPEAPSFTAEARARTQMIRASTEPRRVIYGTTPVSGVLVYAASTGDDNRYMHLVITLAGHRCEEIGTVILNDEAVGDLDAAGMVTSGRFAGKVRIKKHLGAADQVPDADLNAEVPAWAEKYRPLRGIAYLYVRLEWDRDTFPTGIPNIKAMVKGKNDIFDPRTETTGWTDNAALCQRDYIRWTHGLRCAADELREDTWIAAANVADEAVALPGSGSQKRYTLNGSFTLNQNPGDVLAQLRSASAGALIYSMGKWSGYAGAADVATLTLTADDLRGAIKLRTRRPRSELFNAVRGTFVNPDDHWQATDFPAVTDAAAEAADGERIYRDIQLPFTDDIYAAQRIARIELNRHRQQTTVFFPAKLTALRIVPWRPVKLAIAQLGWAEKLFRPTKWKLAEDGGVDLELEEYSPSIYAEDNEGLATADAAPDTTLASPFLPALENVQLLTGDASALVLPGGGVIPRVQISCDAVASAWRIGYEAQWRQPDDTAWRSVQGRDPRLWIDGVAADQTIELRMRALGELTNGPWSAVTEVVARPRQAAPAAPVLAAVGGLLQNALTATWPGGRSDLRYMRIVSAAVNDFAQAQPLTTLIYPDTAYEHTGIAPGVTRWYWGQIADSSGNLSAWSAAVSAAPSADPSALLANLQGALGTDQLAAELAEPVAMIPGHQADLRRLGRAADQAAEAVLNAALKLAAVDGLVTDAGIVTNPDTGEVYIYGLREAEGRLSAAELRINGAEATLSLKASVDYVNQAIATAVIDPSQIAELGDIYARLTAAELSIDGAEAAILLKATQIEVDGIDDRLASAEGEIDVLAGQVALKAETSAVDAIDERLNTAETTLDAIDGASIVQTAESLRRVQRAADATAEAQLAALLFADRNIGALTDVIASAKNELYTHTNDGLAAEAGQRLTLAAQLAATAANLTEEQTVRAEADSAHANSISTLQARLNEGDFATVKTTAEATANGLGEVEARWGVQVQTMADGVRAVGGIELLAGSDGESVLAVVANRLLIYKPDGTGVPKQIVTLGTVNGVPALGLNGDLYVDGGVVTRHLAARIVTGDKIEVDTITADLIVSRSATSFERAVVSLTNGAWYAHPVYMDHAGYLAVLDIANFNFSAGSGTYTYAARVGINSTTSYDGVAGSFTNAAGPGGISLQNADELAAGWHTVYLYAYHSGATGNHTGYATVLKSYR